VIGAAAALALVIVWATTGEVEFDFARAIVTATSVVIIGLLVFDYWLWRHRPFRWLVGRPVLHGTWKVVLRTDHAPRADEEIEAYLVVHQTYSTIRVEGLFEISNSECLSADLSLDGTRCTLSYIFRSEAHSRHRDENPPSRGAASLRVGRRPQLHLEGDYWMERKTRGDIRSVGYTPRIFDTFASARASDFRPH
jgi:hypothetical protein